MNVYSTSNFFIQCEKIINLIGMIKALFSLNDIFNLILINFKSDSVHFY